ncbi:hypothetical protein A7X12_04705 [Sphingomonas sp. TDK1]|nr:hypothetical protein A7X12_04705 [Sphingomonas sp. TDK1]
MPLKRHEVLLLAFATAICAANTYYCQPILADIARDLRIAPAVTGSIVTTVQLGAALGMLLLLPLADLFDPRRLVASVLALDALGLLLMSRAGTALPFRLGALTVGLCGIVTYVLPLYASRHLPASARGHATGLLAMGLLLGAGFARVEAGYIGNLLGWRAVFLIAAVLTGGAAMLLLGVMRPDGTRSKLPYAPQLASLPRLFATHPILWRATLLQAIAFGSFTSIWVVLGVHLRGPAFGLDLAGIGNLALLGFVPAPLAPWIGRLGDRIDATVLLRMWLGLIAVGWAAALLCGDCYVGIVAAIIAIGLGGTGSDINLRTVLYRLEPELRVRVNAVYLSTKFVAAGAMSLAMTALLATLGWQGACAAALATALLGSVLRAIPQASAR